MASSSHSLFLFRNAKSTLTVVARTSELSNKHIATIPLSLRPPSYRRDHWTPFAVVSGLPNSHSVSKLESLLQKNSSPLPRNHREIDPVQDQSLALAKSLIELTNVASEAQSGEITVAWERPDMRNHALTKNIMWPVSVRHTSLPGPRPKPYMERIRKAWDDKTFVAAPPSSL